MGYGEHLRNLLQPLGIYDLAPGSLSGSELDALGAGLDKLSGRLDYAERESALATAETEGGSVCPYAGSLQRCFTAAGDCCVAANRR